MLITFDPAHVSLLGEGGQLSNNWAAVQDDELFQSYTFTAGNRVDVNLGALALSAAGVVTNPTPWLGQATVARRLASGASVGTLSLPSINTLTAKSSLLVGISRGQWTNASPANPSDNKSNTWNLQGSVHAYSAFPASETGVWLAAPNSGGTGQIVSANYGDDGGVGDEMTIVCVEIFDGASLHTSSFREETTPAASFNSQSYTITVPCFIVGIIWGSGNAGQLHTFTSSTGMTKIAAASSEDDPGGSYIQVSTFYAYRQPGTYTETFAGVSNEVGQVYIFAFADTTVDGDAANTLGSVTSSSAGTVTGGGGGATGDLSKTLGAITSSGAGVVTVQGTAADTLGSLTAAGAGAVAIAGAASDTLGAVTDSAAGGVALQGVATDTLGAVTAGASGAAAITAADSSTLGALTSSAAGAVLDTGTASDTLGTMTTTAGGAVAIGGTDSSSLGAVTASSAGAAAIAGVAADTLGAVTLAADGGQPVNIGVLTATLGAVTDTASGTVAVGAASTNTLGAITDTSAAAVAVKGASAAALGPIVDAGGGGVAIAGAAADVLGALTGTATGSGAPVGTLVETLGSVSSSAAAQVAIAGAAALGLGAVRLDTTTSGGTPQLIAVLSQTLDLVGVLVQLPELHGDLSETLELVGMLFDPDAPTA